MTPGFGHAEHLLVWSWRRIAMGGMQCPLMAQEFAGACSENGAEVLLTYCAFLKALGFAGRRRLAVGTPGTMALTPDESQVLALIAAAQNETPALFEAHLRWLTRPKQRHVLGIAARALATALVANGLSLTRPELNMPSLCERPLVVQAARR